MKNVFFEKESFLTSEMSIYPIGSMYGISTNIWFIFMVNVGKYGIHGSYGYVYI